jgi:hypothetical protein
MSNPKRDRKQREEMDKWLEELEPSLRGPLEAAYKTSEFFEQFADRKTEAKLDAAQYALIKDAKAAAEAKRKADAAAAKKAKAQPPGTTELSDEAEAELARRQLSADWELTDKVNGIYYDSLANLELRPLIDVVTERTESKIGHFVQSTDDKLQWLGELEVVKKMAETDITGVLKEVRHANTKIETEWELYDKEWDGRLVAEISEFFGGAVEMRASDFKYVFGVIDRATEELAKEKYESAATSTVSAVGSYAATRLRVGTSSPRSASRARAGWSPASQS